MLKNNDSSAIVAVSDLERARRFYVDVLGLEPVGEDMDGVMVFRTGATQLVVYCSDAAGTNRANAVVWDAGGEIDLIATDLAAKGVVFEHYPGIGEFRANIHHVDGMKLVWFKDPDGNILHVNQMPG
ncbi:VOC family protein [Terrihabitans rhizophilus]|uniref:VOC family protein n=1 Tax=Terrihabitans rhizophilus TaxID=3092662 RepID=A0ABU4RJ54_9HYPH|nr:VOC family protein [Terrihabitans sp. PJ23]MDX6804884.1 VOC family protein [Terrihabitans sp. PJ23]